MKHVLNMPTLYANNLCYNLLLHKPDFCISEKHKIYLHMIRCEGIKNTLYDHVWRGICIMIPIWYGEERERKVRSVYMALSFEWLCRFEAVYYYTRTTVIYKVL